MAKMSFAKKMASATDPRVKSWKVVIADDEPDVHTLTKTVLNDFEYDGRPLEFISTYSGEETFDFIRDNEDVAMVLLDVVMETDDAGLITAKRIREELKNDTIQIVLRTGQPGYAPETDVVVNYAINDYKEKTELTAKKLLTTIITALRSYKILKSLEANKKGLKQIIDSTESLLLYQTNQLFTQGVLTQLASILQINHDAILVETFNGLSVEINHDQFTILTTSGIFEGIESFDELDGSVQELIKSSLLQRQSLFEENRYVGYLELGSDTCSLIYIESYQELKPMDKHLIEIFFNHSTIALNNLKLHEEMFSTQKSLIEVLSEIIEKRYIDDPTHLKRLSKVSHLLASRCGLNEQKADLFRMVAPLQDVGKIGISDSILLKPAKLSEEEFEVVKTHTTIGYNLLHGTGKETLEVAAMIAHEHHEHWDGNGYPQGLKEYEISLYGRIAAIIDVYDALAGQRCYKEPWEPQKVYDYFKEQKGKQFDPDICQVFLDNFDEFEKIRVEG